MSDRSRREPLVLLAASLAAIRELRAVIEAEFDVVATDDPQEAVTLLHRMSPDLVVVGYHFDGLRPFRFIGAVRELPRRPPPIVLVRVLPLRFGRADEAEIRDAYERLGVSAFFSLPEEASRHGRDAALQRLRELVANRLRR